MIAQSIVAFLRPHTSSLSTPLVARSMCCLMTGDFNGEDFNQVLDAQLDSLGISSQAKQSIIPALLGIAKLAKVQSQRYVHAAFVPLYGPYLMQPARPRRPHYPHPACLGPSSPTLTPEPLIRCASDPFLLIPEVVTPFGTLESLIRVS
jgi:hypothetical protein